MTDQELLDRIVCDPKIVVGKPVIRGTRLTIEYILNRLGHRATVEELLAEYKGLTHDDILASWLFASNSLLSNA